MYIHLLYLHSLTRWLVVVTLVAALYKSFRGWIAQTSFTPFDNTLRHVTATLAHVQLAIGYILYFKSPVVAWFRQHPAQPNDPVDYTFFGIIHITAMTAAVIVITIGSSLAKRHQSGEAKFKTMALCFAAGALLIALAVPWPFSPWVTRPWIRTF